MKVNFIKNFTDTAGIIGLIFILITLIGMVSPEFSLIAMLAIGLGALTYLFNICVRPFIHLQEEMQGAGFLSKKLTFGCFVFDSLSIDHR
jgi:uncharacterized membrane protein YkgB